MKNIKMQIQKGLTKGQKTYQFDIEHDQTSPMVVSKYSGGIGIVRCILYLGLPLPLGFFLIFFSALFKFEP